MYANQVRTFQDQPLRECSSTHGDAPNEPRASDLRRKRTTDLPVMAEWIDHAAQAPPIIFLHRDDLSGTCRKRLREHRIRIRHGQDHSSRSTAQRLWTEVAMLRGLVTQPKLRTSNGQPRHHRTTGILHTVDLDRPECRLVELNRSRAISNRQHGRDRIHNGSPRACLCAHLSLPDHLRLAWRLEARRIMNPYNEQLAELHTQYARQRLQSSSDGVRPQCCG